MKIEPFTVELSFEATLVGNELTLLAINTDGDAHRYHLLVPTGRPEDGLRSTIAKSLQSLVGIAATRNALVFDGFPYTGPAPRKLTDAEVEEAARALR